MIHASVTALSFEWATTHRGISVMLRGYLPCSKDMHVLWQSKWLLHAADLMLSLKLRHASLQRKAAE